MTMHRSCLAFGLLALPLAASATTRTWPGAAPCDTTLQACINASSANDAVEVASNAVIDEGLSFGVPLSLRAAAGYKPQLALDRNIFVSAGSDGSYVVEGFVLQRGSVGVNHAGGNVSVSVRRVKVLAPLTGGGAEISLYSPGSGSLDYEVAENELAHAWSTFDGGIHAALQVLDFNGSGDGTIRDNRVDAGGSNATGILVNTLDGAHTTRVFANWVRGGNSYGSIGLRQGSFSPGGGGSLTAYVLNNVVTPLPGNASGPQGIEADVYDGSLTLSAFNNTVTGSLYGIGVSSSSGTTLAGRIANNLLAGNTLSLLVGNGGSGSIANDHNLLYGGSTSGVTPGAGTVTSDPQLRGAPHNPWLNAGSPAIGAADGTALGNTLAAASLPRVDGAGLRRFKGAGNLADIGALEYGDTTFLHRVDNSIPLADYVSPLDDPGVNGQPARWPQFTANWNPFGGSGIYHTQPTGAIYLSGGGYWQLRTENATNFPNGAAFNLFAPADGSGNYFHVTGAGNVSGDATVLDHPDLNNNCNRIMLATRDSLNPGGGLSNDTHPFAAACFGFGGPTSWIVTHTDSTAMGAGGGYHIYFQEPSANAYVHTTSAGNRSGDYTVLDHPLLNGRGCARPHVTQNPLGGFNPHQIGVFYTGTGRWAIFNQDLATMPLGTLFFVVVDAQQAFECSDVIFANGFE